MYQPLLSLVIGFVLGFALRTLVYLALKAYRRQRRFRKEIDEKKIELDDIDKFQDTEPFKNYFKRGI